jgi:hypothetical protein
MKFKINILDSKDSNPEYENSRMEMNSSRNLEGS